MIFVLMLVFNIFVFADQATEVVEAVTELQLPELPKDTKLTAGDVVQVVVTPLPSFEDAEPTIANALKEGPYEVGLIRILWWKKADQKPVLGLTSYHAQLVEVPSIVFTKDGNAVFRSQPQKLEFAPVKSDDQNIFPPISVGFPVWIKVLVGILILATVLAILWLISTWSQRQKVKLQPVPAPEISPLEEFQKACALIHEKGYLTKKHYKPHYFALSEAVKRYFARIYLFDAEECTTREILEKLKELLLNKTLLSQWKNLLEEMDVVKFTDQIPIEKYAESLMERLILLVQGKNLNAP